MLCYVRPLLEFRGFPSSSAASCLAPRLSAPRCSAAHYASPPARCSGGSRRWSSCRRSSSLAASRRCPRAARPSTTAFTMTSSTRAAGTRPTGATRSHHVNPRRWFPRHRKPLRTLSCRRRDGFVSRGGGKQSANDEERGAHE